MKLSFHGAAQDVTGSCNLLEVQGKRVLVDCGLFQSGHGRDPRNAERFGFDPASIDILLLTHAHLDHCGRIPLLVKRGFRGEIITTAASRDLAKLILLDAAHIEEEDAERHARYLRRKGKSGSPPLFTVYDAVRSFDLFGRTANLNTRIELGRNLWVKFMEAGHILGSTFLVIDAGEEDDRKRFVFSGDLGRYAGAILPDPSPPPECDFLVMETTYGDRRHKSHTATVSEFHNAILQTLDEGGNVIIPTFALERAQELLYHLRDAVMKGLLPKHLPVFLDSPMAISATQIFRDHGKCFRPEIRKDLEEGRDPFDLPGLRCSRQVTESMAINRISGGAVILAGSGMCTGGRVLHHLKHNLWRPESSVIFVGFAAEGTLARKIIEGNRQISIFGETIEVRANIYTINGFSAHAGQDELQRWCASAGKPTRTFLVHGDQEGGMAAMAKLMSEEGREVSCPRIQEFFAL